MNRIDVVSKSIRNIGYDEKRRHLEVEFHNGRQYRYEDVHKRIFHRFLNSDSIGNFFHTEIRPFFRGIELNANRDSIAKDEEQGSGV